MIGIRLYLQREVL